MGSGLHLVRSSVAKRASSRHVILAPAIIKKLAAKAIIGTDFMTKYGVVLDMSNLSVKFPSPTNAICEVEEVHEVKTTKKRSIPPHSAAWVECTSKGVGLGYFESEFIVADAALLELSGKKNKFRVFVHNPTNIMLDLPAGGCLGSFTKAEESEVLSIDSLTRKSFKPTKAPDSAKKLIDECQIKGSDKFISDMKDLLCEFHDVISKSPTDLGISDAVQHEIRLRDAEPVHIRQFRIPEDHLEFLNNHVTQLLAQGCIELSSSSYNAPIFCVRKPKGGLRVVQDFRALNEKSYDDKYSIREIQECIDNIGRMGSKVFSTLDLTSGFWQQRLHPDSQKYTAFSVPGRARFHWLVNPMGLKGSPSSFQRLMDLVMTELANVQCYIDDVLVHSPSEDDHLRHMRSCLVRLRKFNLKINLAKCAFGRTEVPYLGHVLTPQGVKPSVDKLKAVRDFPEPQNLKALREFHGLTNYFRAHIKNFALLAGQLTKLTRKDSGWKSGPLPPAAKIAFIQLKQRLCEGPMLAYPMPGRPYMLSVDAATGCAEHNGGLGAILSQLDGEGTERVVSYASRTLRDFEKNYTPYLLEMTAATWAIDHFHVYLLGRKFTLLTDHRPLEKMSTLHKKTLNRLQEQMMEYNFIVAYRKGSENAGPDALSRNPVDAIGVPDTCFKDLQDKDELIKDIKAFITQGWLPSAAAKAKTVIQLAAHCTVENDVVYFTIRRKGIEPKPVLFVPKALQQDLVYAHHAARFAGHSGPFKTTLKLQEKFYWPGMQADVTSFIEKCATCLRTKSPPGHLRRTPLDPLDIPDMPNIRVHMDLMGALRTSDKGKKFILVMTDAFTKYAISTAIENKEAKTVAKALFDNWICRFSVPRNLTSDRGREFCNEVIDELCVLLGIDRARTAAFHPQANASAERFNRTFIKLTTQMLEDASTLDWEEQLPAVMLAYNTQVHKATLHSPFYLTHLYPPNLPYFDFEEPVRHYGDSWAVEAFHRLQAAFRRAHDNNLEAREAMKATFDKKTTERHFQIGDRVLINLPKPATAARLGEKKFNAKFIPAWLPGFTIVKVLGPNTYQAKSAPRKQPVTLHAERLKLDRSTYTPTTPRPATTDPTTQAASRETAEQAAPPGTADHGEPSTAVPAAPSNTQNRPVTRSMTKEGRRQLAADVIGELGRLWDSKKKKERSARHARPPEPPIWVSADPEERESNAAANPTSSPPRSRPTSRPQTGRTRPRRSRSPVRGPKGRHLIDPDDHG